MTDKELHVRALEIMGRMTTDQIADWMVAGWKEGWDKSEFLAKVANKIRPTHPELANEIADYICSWGGAA